MDDITKQDAQGQAADATDAADGAARKLGLNKETLRDLETPGGDEVKGGILMRDTVIIPRPR